jgi:hypothetical protein
LPTEVTLVDGDGTSRFFTWTRRAPPIRRTGSTAAPAGAHLLLQKHLGGDAARAWVMTKPDRTQFFFDSDGYSSAVVDREQCLKPVDEVLGGVPSREIQIQESS